MNISAKNLMSSDLWIDLLKLFWPPIVVLTVHVFISHGIHLYTLLPWIDIPMHYLGGLSVGYSLFRALTVLQEHHIISPLDKVIALLLTFALVATIAVFWEFAEFSMDQLLKTNVQISLQNTMQDLFMGILGAVTVVGINIKK